MRELKAGDKVFIRKDLEDNCRYGIYNWVKCMLTGWQEVRSVNINGVFDLVKDGIHCYTPEMIDWDKTINNFEIKVTFPTEIEKTITNISKKMDKCVKENLISGAELKYDGTVLQGMLDDRHVLVKRSEKDTDDLEKACMMALIKTLGFNYQDVKNIMKNVKMIWKPQDGEKYYCIQFNEIDFSITDYVYMNDVLDVVYLSNGNCFKTREEAEEKLEKIKAILKGE